MKTTLHRILRVVLVAGFLCLSASGRADDKKPAVARKPHMLRTYRFTAKIVYNGGVTPFKVGTKLTGEFTYDLSAKDEFKPKFNGLYRSPKNKIAIRYGKLHFSSQGPVRINVTVANSSEGLSISGDNLTFPKDWHAERDPRDGKDRSYLIVSFQNSPRGGVLSGTTIPERLDFWKRFSAHTIGLDFIDGVDFPGGRIEKRAGVYANIESLELVRSEVTKAKTKR